MTTAQEAGGIARRNASRIGFHGSPYSSEARAFNGRPWPVTAELCDEERNESTFSASPCIKGSYSSHDPIKTWIRGGSRTVRAGEMKAHPDWVGHWAVFLIGSRKLHRLSRRCLFALDSPVVFELLKCSRLARPRVVQNSAASGNGVGAVGGLEPAGEVPARAEEDCNGGGQRVASAGTGISCSLLGGASDSATASRSATRLDGSVAGELRSRGPGLRELRLEVVSRGAGREHRPARLAIRRWESWQSWFVPCTLFRGRGKVPVGSQSLRQSLPRPAEPHVNRGGGDFEPVRDCVRVVIESVPQGQDLAVARGQFFEDRLAAGRTSRLVPVVRSASVVSIGSRPAFPGAASRCGERRSWHSPPRDSAPPVRSQARGF